MEFDNFYKEQLKHWLRYDSWSAEEAFRLFIECHPGTNGFVPLCDPICWDDDEARWVHNKQFEFKRLWDVWRSGYRIGEHEEEFFAPAYYIEWAKKKGIDIPWLKWVEEQQLIFHLAKGDDVQEVGKPLTTKEKTSLLTIIALLAEEAKIDWKQPTKAATSILYQADKLNVQIGQRTIEEYLKQIPDALERRMKPEA